MAIDRRKQFNKQPYEKIPIDVCFWDAIPISAEEIVSSEASAQKWHRRDPNNKSDASLEILHSTTPVIVGRYKDKVRILVKDGENDYDYQITVKAVFDNGAQLEEEIFVRVRED